MQHPVSENVVHASVLYLIIKAFKKYLFIITYHALLALHVPKMNTGFDFSKAQISRRGRRIDLLRGEEEQKSP